MSSQGPSEPLLYVGTYTARERGAPHREHGIYVYRMHPRTGALRLVQAVGGLLNPSFVALHPSGRYLYAVNELDEGAGRPAGAISAFAVDPSTGQLAPLNQQPSLGTSPCHLSVEATGRFVLVANYGSGSVAMLPIQSDGRLEPASDFVQHSGSSQNPTRQEGPHAHSITPDPANRFALAADLGLDRVLVYRLELDRGKLAPHPEGAGVLHPGAGPRHLAFSPDGAWCYVIDEIDSTLTTFAYDAPRGALRAVQTLSTLPPGFAGTSWCADVHVAPSGRFVYGSNRGHDSIAVYARDGATGLLSPSGHAATGGQTPRNFAIAPGGELLLAANQDSDSIVAFAIDPATGALRATGSVAATPAPVCLAFARLE